MNEEQILVTGTLIMLLLFMLHNVAKIKLLEIELMKIKNKEIERIIKLSQERR